MSHRCNRCGRSWNDGDASDNEFLCTRKCGGALVRVPADEVDGLQDTGVVAYGAILSVIPCILAIPLHEYIVEKHPVVRLWNVCDAMELTLRFAVMAGLADLTRRGPLPDDLLRQLRDRIEKPSLGKWQGMAEAVVAFLPEETVLPELRPLVKNQLKLLLDGEPLPRTASTSLSVLRGQLAHGGGVTKTVAARLLDAWERRMDSFVHSLAWTADILLVVRTPEWKAGLLRGPHPRPQLWQPPEAMAASVSAAFSRGDEVLLLRDGNVLTLWPLTLFGQPRIADPDVEPPSEILFQVYVRRGDIDLQFTPLGSEVCPGSEGDEKTHDAFRALFRIDEVATEKRQKGFDVRGFEGDLRKDAGELVGRARDLYTIGQKLAEHREGGVLWLTGPAGIGKSYLLASIAAELLDRPPGDTLVLAYRFKAGDDRCTRESFLRFAVERLHAALPEMRTESGLGEKAEGGDEITDTSAQGLLSELKTRLGALAGRKVLFILDGLDEIAERDARFATEIPLALPLPGVLWLCAGRSERGLPEAFSTATCVHVFPDGVPPMETEDLRTMLLEQIGPMRKRLLANDREQGDHVDNAFVSKVADCAGGLPLFVRYVVNDIKGLRLRVLDAHEQIPPSLDRYHEELLRRCAIGILQQVVTPLVATLAVAQEPLTVAALHEILARGNVIPDDEGAPPLIRRALAAVASMVRRTVTRQGGEGYALFHHSLRQHMEESKEMAPALATARNNLASLALCWEEIPRGSPLVSYLARWGLAHCVAAGRSEEAPNHAVRLARTGAPAYIKALITGMYDLAPHAPQTVTAVLHRLNTEPNFGARYACLMYYVWRLPTPIAQSLDRSQPNPVESNADIRAFTVAEVVTAAMKFVGILTLADCLTGVAPPRDVGYRLPDLRRPTLGQWAAIPESYYRASIVPGFPVQLQFLQRLFSERQHALRRTHNGLVRFRNEWAHSAPAEQRVDLMLNDNWQLVQAYFEAIFVLTEGQLLLFEERLDARRCRCRVLAGPDISSAESIDLDCSLPLAPLQLLFRMGESLVVLPPLLLCRADVDGRRHLLLFSGVHGTTSDYWDLTLQQRVKVTTEDTGLATLWEWLRESDRTRSAMGG